MPSRFPGPVTHHVKVREKGKKKWLFLATGGSANALRIHALEFTKDGAEALVAENSEDNPEWEFKVVPIDR